MDQLHRGPDPFVDFLFVAPAEDETPEDAWFLGVKKKWREIWSLWSSAWF